jgi:FlaA1/EpsC-like NDP-sugar epimerase
MALINFYLNRLFIAPRFIKRRISIFFDIAFVLAAFWLALFVRLDTSTIFYEKTYWILLSVLIPLSLMINLKLGSYRAVVRYISHRSIVYLVSAVFLTSFLLVVVSFFFVPTLPRTVPIIFFAFLMIFVGGSRFMIRLTLLSQPNKNKEKVMIYGAGASGPQLAQSLFQGNEYHPVAFIDDDNIKHKTIIQGLSVYSPKKLSELIENKGVKKLLLALPSASRNRRKKILRSIESLSLQVLTIPGIADIVSGSAKLDDIKEVDIDDLLGRDSIAPKVELMSADIQDKVVMITGAGGSIGSELSRQILWQRPQKIVLIELSEFALYTINSELQKLANRLDYHLSIIPLLGSVQHKNRLFRVMKNFKVQTIYHTAAYKHVPLVEHNMIEGIRNNIYGTYFTAQAAIDAGVETFVLISTDKAVRPTNLMGASKRMAELVLQALAKKQHQTRFCMVRFGNVLGSSGSVVPLFRKQIKQGGPITLTHPDITRFFMTIPEAAQLVIQAGSMGMGGDVFVLDMGESVKIKDLATKMVRLSGLEIQDDEHPDGDIAIQCTGLRPGEKLYEELLIGKNVKGTTHPRIMTAHEVMLHWDELDILLNQLDTACHNFDLLAIRQFLLEAPIDFKPKDKIVDFLWSPS